MLMPPQDPETLRTIESIAEAVQARYVNGLPLHIAEPDRSAIKIIPEQDFIRTMDADIQDILRTKNIVITGIPYEEKTFKGALRDTTPLSSVVDIQGNLICNFFP
jgi:hypothetical protein